jgi:hypothetical protein
MSWFWLNIPLAAVFFAAWTAIPLWIVLKRPDRGPVSADTYPVKAAEPELVTVGDRREEALDAVAA